ncbi:hypothetical protein NMY22_g3823 [Coprinellus aureogranulatus]|nr:hypothetical protein NMY22_g3823 [Coprinellus aureogranulatus]
MATTVLDFANVYVRTWFTNLVLSLFMLGIQFFLCSYVLIVFLETPKARRQGRWPYIVLVFVMFILSAIPTCFDAALIFFGLLETSTARDVLSVQSTSSPYAWLKYPGQAVPTPLLMLISDGVLLYRAYIVCTGSRWMVVLPFLLWVASIVLTIFSISRSATRFIFVNLPVIFSVVMTIVITVIISTRLVKARRQILCSLPRESSGLAKRYTSVIAILIESALPLSVFGLTHAVTDIISTAQHGPPTTTMTNTAAISMVVSVLYYSFTALSPQLIIFRVTLGRSWTRNFQQFLTSECAADQSTSGVGSGALVFARGGEEEEGRLDISNDDNNLRLVADEREKDGEKV